MDSLPQSAKSSLVAVYEDRTTAEYGWDQVLTGYQCRHDVPLADRAAALAILDVALSPAPVEAVAREVTRLRMMTKARAEDATDTKFMAAAYMEELTRYPADIVSDALRFWARNEKWWPAWSELRDLLDARVRRRRAMKAALERLARNGASEG
jgi:hypothetical protein